MIIIGIIKQSFYEFNLIIHLNNLNYQKLEKHNDDLKSIIESNYNKIQYKTILKKYKIRKRLNIAPTENYNYHNHYIYNPTLIVNSNKTKILFHYIEKGKIKNKLEINRIFI